MKYTNKTAFCATQKSTQLSLLLSRKHSLTFIKHTLLLGLLLMVIFAQAQEAILYETVWDVDNPPPSTYTEGIEIIQGGSLTIIGLSLNFDNNKSILIQNGSLIVKNSTLTFEGIDAQISITDHHSNPLIRNLTCINSILKARKTNWRGINVRESNAGMVPSQYLKEPDYDTDCGNGNWFGEPIADGKYAHITLTGCTIKDAETALHVTGPHELLKAGGTITELRNNQIMNCLTGFWFENFDGDQIEGGLPLSEKYAGYIMNCHFTWDDSYTFKGIPNEANQHRNCHLYFYHNMGWMNIGGCTFENNRTDILCPDQRGTGIKCIKSSVYVGYDGDDCCKDEESGCTRNCYADGSPSRRNRFEKLGKGVYMHLQGSSGKIYSLGKNGVRHSDFVNCAKALYAGGVEGIEFINNTFTIEKNDFEKWFYTTENNPEDACEFPTPGAAFFPVATEFSECSGLSIFSNTFVSDMKNGDFITINNGELKTYGSQIKDNTFRNLYTPLANYTVIRGIVANGYQKHLDITCNTFENLYTDISSLGNFGEALDDIPNGRPLDGNNIYSNTPFDNLLVNASTKVYIQSTTPPTGNYQQEPALDGVSCDVSCKEYKKKELSVSDIKRTNGIFEIIPNPANQSFTISLAASSGGIYTSYVIHSVSGEILQEGIIQGMNSRIDIKTLASGVYYITVSGRTHASVKKFVKL